MSSYTIKEVDVDAYWEEAKALTVAHHEEVEDQTLPLVVDKELYTNLYNAGMLYIFVVLKDTELVGYTIFLTTPSLHHKNTAVATCDVIYLKKDCRGRTAFDLLRYAEHTLEQQGVEFVFMTVKTKLDFSKLLEREGYAHVEQVYSKQLRKQ